MSVLEAKCPQLKADFSLLSVFSTSLNSGNNRPARLQGFGSSISAGSQNLTHFKKGRSHDPVGELSLSQEASGGSVAHNVEVGLGIVHLELLLGRSSGLGVEIKDADLDVVRDSEFVAIQKDNRRPRRIQVVEDSGFRKQKMLEINHHRH